MKASKEAKEAIYRYIRGILTNFTDTANIEGVSEESGISVEELWDAYGEVCNEIARKGKSLK